MSGWQIGKTSNRSESFEGTQNLFLVGFSCTAFDDVACYGHTNILQWPSPSAPDENKELTSGHTSHEFGGQKVFWGVADEQ